MNQPQHNKALHPTAYSSIRCVSLVPRFTALIPLPAAGELSRSAACARLGRVCHNFPMPNKSSGVYDIEIFELEPSRQCVLCNRSCNSGLWLHLGNGYSNAHLPLCLKCGVTALECNAVSLPIGLHFLVSRAEASKLEDFLSRLRRIVEEQKVSLEEKAEAGQIDYWHEESSDRSISHSKLRKEVHHQHGGHFFQAAIYEHTENCFEVRYYHREYVELGEYAWMPTRKEKSTFARDYQSAKEIAQVELRQVCLVKHYNA